MLLVAQVLEISCTNGQYTEGLSMHNFPDPRKKPKLYQKWVNFVRRHRRDFDPSRDVTPVLYSVHFEQTEFLRLLPVADSIGMKRKLKPDVEPAKDIAGPQKADDEPLTDRQRRKVCRPMFVFVYTKPPLTLSLIGLGSRPSFS